MHFPSDINADAIKRLRRVEGQIRGLQRMVEDEAECKEIMTQLAAAKGALDRVGFKMMAAAMTDPDGADVEELERLFLKLG